jgi:hypothetical protein
LATGQNIVDEVRRQLNDGDASNRRWDDTEMLDYVNAGQRQIVMLVPEANIIESQETIAADSGPRQTIPADGIKFIAVNSGYDATNAIRGPQLRYVEFDALNGMFPTWGYTQVEQPRVPNFGDLYTEVLFEHYAHDPRDPKAYWLYPAPDGTARDIFLLYAQLPADLAALANTVVLDDEYQNAMVEYVTFRALMKDGRYGSGTERRQELWNAFRQSLGLKPEIDRRYGPERNKPPEAP